LGVWYFGRPACHVRDLVLPGFASATVASVPDWPEHFVSAYAASHPWEDWAETWAQYLNMVDTLEIAAACGLSLTPRRRARVGGPRKVGDARANASR
jgi:hypothetical protein